MAAWEWSATDMRYLTPSNKLLIVNRTRKSRHMRRVSGDYPVTIKSAKRSQQVLRQAIVHRMR
jgi:hypothetical protein